ncbi:hypothetical protein MTO96_052282 [Rhipicephalus appendiculatus]
MHAESRQPQPCTPREWTYRNIRAGSDFLLAKTSAAVAREGHSVAPGVCCRKSDNGTIQREAGSRRPRLRRRMACSAAEHMRDEGSRKVKKNKTRPRDTKPSF